MGLPRGPRDNSYSHHLVILTDQRVRKYAPYLLTDDLTMSSNVILVTEVYLLKIKHNWGMTLPVISLSSLQIKEQKNMLPFHSDSFIER